MRWLTRLRRKKAAPTTGTATPLHGIACKCPMCGFTMLLSTVPLDRQLTRHLKRPQIARARLVVSAPK